MMKPLILIDLDDTVWEFCKPLLHRYNDVFAANLDIEDITEYDFSHKLQIPLEEFFQRFLTEDYFETFRPHEAIVECINQLAFSNKYTIKFCTAGGHRTAMWRLKKLDNLFAWFTHKDLILCKDKQLVRGHFLIDDCLDNFKPHQLGFSPTYIPIIPDMPWNRNVNELKQCCNGPIKIFQWDYSVLCQYINEQTMKG